MSPAQNAAAQQQQVSHVATFVTLLLFSIYALVYAISAIIVFWRLYRKAERPGWASIIPYYGTWEMAKIARRPGWWGLVPPIVGTVSDLVPSLKILNLVSLLLALTLFILFAKKYDRGIGFWIVFVFLPIITVFKVNEANYLGETPSTPAAPAPSSPTTVVPAPIPVAEPTPPVAPSPNTVPTDTTVPEA